MRFSRRPPLWRLVLLLAGGLALVGYGFRFGDYRWRLNPRVADRVGLIPKSVRVTHELQLQRLFEESGVDIRFLLVPTTGGETLEQFAVREARTRGLGRDAGRRGVLIVYDTLRREVRVEVGPNLQGVLPDGFVGYIVREHLRPFFARGDVELGLRTTVFLLHWRIREARLGDEYHPAFEEYVRDVRRLASGGGASGAIGSGVAASGVYARADSATRAYFSPASTVEGTYRRYLEWLAQQQYYPDVSMFTQPSRNYYRGVPLTAGFRSGMLAMEYGRSYIVDERGDLAMLYYTGTPFRSPLFFRRTVSGWEMDALAELRNSLEAVGGPYTWLFIDSGDEYSRAFADRYMPLEGDWPEPLYRVAGGDNRPLPTRGIATDAVESEAAVRGSVLPIAEAPARLIERMTVGEAAARVRRAEGRPSIVVFYMTFTNWEETFAGLGRLAAFSRESGVELLAFNTDHEAHLVEDLPGRLSAAKADAVPLMHIYSWKAGVFSTTLQELGIAGGREWLPPLVAVRDAAGKVTWQAQGVDQWDAVIAAARAAAR